MPSYPSYGFGPSVPAAVPAHGVMDTTSTPSPRQPFVPASPMTPPLTGSEISGDSLSQGHGWTPTNTTPGGRSGYNSGYNSASGYVSGGAGSRSGTGSQDPPTRSRATALASAHKRRGSTSMRMADEDSYGSDPESELGLNLPADVVVSRRREEIRRQRIESEQRRRDDLREGFARLKDVLPVSNQKGSKMALLDRVYPLWPINLVACDPGPRLRSRQPPPITQTKLADPLLFTATSHIRYLEAMQQQMQTKLTASEMEVNRLRQINEALMLKAAERRSSQSPL
ncbi:helix loop helix domain [Rhizoctonia solani]|uniref:Helix loop helix domain n=1 Tax=Rhizoctonia solani TaxID=456999 RepID=A0A8H7IES1_9AGAM|nr:helix loop helix domain [Rhizoctonia solani]